MLPFRPGDWRTRLWLRLGISSRDLMIAISISLRSKCSSCRNWGRARDEEELLLPLGPGGGLAWIQMPSHAWGASLMKAGLRPTGGFAGSLAPRVSGAGLLPGFEEWLFQEAVASFSQCKISVSSNPCQVLLKAIASFPLHWGWLGGPLHLSIRASVTVTGWDSCSWQSKDLRKAVSAAGWRQGMQARRSEQRGPMSCFWILKRLLLGNPWANPYLCVLGCNCNQYFLSIY